MEQKYSSSFFVKLWAIIFFHQMDSLVSLEEIQNLNDYRYVLHFHIYSKKQ